MNWLERQKLRCTPMGAGLRFGDGGDSTQQSSTSTTNVTETTDRRTVADGGSVVVGDGSTVHTSDLGAVQRAADLAEKALVGSTTLATEANASAGKLAASAIGEIKKAYETATEQASGNKTLAVVGMVVAAVIGIAIWQEKSKA